MAKPSTSHHHLHPQQQPQYSQFNLPHPQTHTAVAVNPVNVIQPQSVAIHPQVTTHHQRATAVPTTQIFSSPFIEQPQFITAIPIQPPAFPTSTTVVAPIQPPPDYVHSSVVLTPAQNQIQDHLQRKHEELQKLIVQQQDELRRVSEQLFMARYGMLPSIVNVSLPFVAPMESSDGSMSYSDHHQQQQPQMAINHQQQHQQQMSNQNLHQNLGQQQQQQQQQHQQAIPIHYDLNQQHQQQQKIMDHPMDSDQSDNIMQQYIQHSTASQSQMHQAQIQHQQQTQPMMTNDNDFELMPFQMMNQQAQILFASSSNSNSNNNNNGGSNVNSSNK